MTVDKLTIANRLNTTGLRQAADTYREEVRTRLVKENGGAKRNREAVNDASWEEMWEVFRPAVERWEKEKRDSEPPQLLGCSDDLEEFLDPNYSESDPGKWLRDGLIWTAAEIRRVVRDSPDGTTVDLARAKTPPPTAWAVFCLESFARKSPDKRSDLIARVLTFATRSHDAPDETTSDEHDGGFLDSV
jgi:hypothetical protein